MLSRYHQKRYLSLKSRLKFYRIPILVLSALNSVTAVGLSPYLQQNYVSLLNMSMSLIVGIIGSVEMYYGINTQMEIESNGSRDFYILGTDIYKYLSLKEEHKSELSVEFLNTSYNRYIKLVETSLVLKKKVEDKLSIIEIDTNQIISQHTPALTPSLTTALTPTHTQVLIPTHTPSVTQVLAQNNTTLSIISNTSDLSLSSDE